MNVINKANIINAVADGAAILCPKCGMANKIGSQFCSSCQTELSSALNCQSTENDLEKYVEPISVFATGLPSWDILPPQVVVRRPQLK